MSLDPKGAASSVGLTHAGPIEGGLRTDQAPPLSIPMSFFLLGTLAMLASGLLLAFAGAAALASRWLPLAFALTHLGTLGFLCSVMFGALYQMIPVVAGSPVPGARLAHAVHAGWALGVVLFVVALGVSHPGLLLVASALLGATLLAFLVPTALALLGAPTRSDAVRGMKLATAGLAAVAVLGTLLAIGRAGRLALAMDPLSHLAAHAVLGGLVWVGGLVVAVSWEVIPMFYLTEPLPRWSRRATLLALVFALVSVPLAALLGARAWQVVACAAPAAVLVWLVHPALTLRAIRGRRRRRADPSLRFWQLGLGTAPLVLLVALGAALDPDPRWSVALGFVSVWGWAGFVVHGMLCRIVPFVVWFHRYSPLAGRTAVPSMRQLLPDRRIRVGLYLHAAAVATGLLAIGLGSTAQWLTTLAGVLLSTTALTLGANLVHALWPRPPAPASD